MMVGNAIGITVSDPDAITVVTAVPRRRDWLTAGSLRIRT
jgi:hypothetical protein